MLFWRLLLSSCWPLCPLVGFPFLSFDPCTEKGVFLHTNANHSIFSPFASIFCDPWRRLWSGESHSRSAACQTVISCNNPVHHVQSHFIPFSGLICWLWSPARLISICINAVSCFSMIGSLASFKNILHTLKRECTCTSGSNVHIL